MALKHRKSWLTACTLVAIAVGVGWSFAQPGTNQNQSPAPVNLLPQEALLFVTTDGSLAHRDAWEQTAAYQAIEESGLEAMFEKVIDGFHQLAAAQGAGGFVSLGRTALIHLRDHGLSLAATVVPQQNGPPTGYAILVLHDAARFEETVAQLIMGGTQGELDFQQADKAGRTVTFAVIPDSPGVEVGWWQESGHLVLVAGIQAVDSAIAVATGVAPNATTHPLYQKYVAGEHDFEVNTSGWLDVASIRQLTSGIPLPLETGPNAEGPLTVGHVIDMLGLSNLNSIVSASGFKGKALWSESWVDAPGPRKGLLAMGDGEPLTLQDLPPLPFGLNAMTATRFQPAGLYDDALESVRRLATFAPSEEAGEEIERGIQQAREALGMDVREELLAHLGDTLCGYNDTQQGLLNMGAGFLVELDDPDAFRAGLQKLLAAVERLSDGQFLARQVEKQGRDVILMEFHPTPFGYALCIDQNWLVVGSPQVVEAYLLRVDGKLPRWTPSPEYATALGELPSEFSALSVSDPRGFINLLAGLAPTAIGLAEIGIRESGEFPEDFKLPIHIEDFPPAELISHPLFPNVAAMQVTEDGFHSQARTSLPGIPMSGSGDAATTAAVVGVGVALLLPAVQAAREAARRTQSANNIKQLALAMHNYADVHNHFPSATVLNSDLEPEQRLSWIVEVLPYLEQAAIYEQIDRSKGWQNVDNLELASLVIEVLTNPGAVEGATVFTADGDWLGATHYVGIGGLGEDGPNLGVRDPKAGVFGYDRRTKFADIRDGTSNTIMFSEATGEYGGWMQGGRATVRPFTQQPYINGPDGIGGPFNGGANMGFADGAVRFINSDIDPSVLEAITTINGGEAVGDF